MKIKSLNKQKGQNTAEYLVMLVLIAGGSIGMFTYFGTTIKAQLGNVIAAIGGSTTSNDVSALGASAVTAGQASVSMKTNAMKAVTPTVTAVP